ncbi:MAG: hypothetical protein AB7P37_18020 [Ramlibacter sp.]
MPFDIRIDRHPEYVKFSMEGTASMPNFIALVDTVEAETIFWSDRNALFDLRAVQDELAPEEQVFLGELVGRSLAHLDRLASVVPAQRITRRSEGAAQQMGVRLRVFADVHEATQWLVEGYEESAPTMLQESEGLRRLLNGREID